MTSLVLHPFSAIFTVTVSIIQREILSLATESHMFIDSSDSPNHFLKHTSPALHLKFPSSACRQHNQYLNPRNVRTNAQIMHVCHATFNMLPQRCHSCPSEAFCAYLQKFTPRSNDTAYHIVARLISFATGNHNAAYHGRCQYAPCTTYLAVRTYDVAYAHG